MRTGIGLWYPRHGGQFVPQREFLPLAMVLEDRLMARLAKASGRLGLRFRSRLAKRRYWDAVFGRVYTMGRV